MFDLDYYLNMKINLQEVRTAIITGELDNELDGLTQAISFRRSQQVNQTRINLSVGQHVWFNQSVRPTYMVGAEAIVKKINRKRIEVDLLEPAGRFHKGVRATLSIITTTKPQ